LQGGLSVPSSRKSPRMWKPAKHPQRLRAIALCGILAVAVAGHAATTEVAEQVTAPQSVGVNDHRKHLSLFHIGEDVVRLSPAVQVLAIVASTLISEDVTCITIGTLIQHHKIPWLRGGAACFLGIYIGDLSFFFLGRFAGARLLKVRFFYRAVGEERLKQFGEWFDNKPWAAIMACRFLPGIRVPLYLSVGALSRRTSAFFWWTCFFAFVWTPALIGAVILLGDAITGPLQFVFGKGWWTVPITIVVILAIVKLCMMLSTAEGRGKLKGWFQRNRTEANSKDRPGADMARPGS
jgi:membrane protein DedA with SNARE-associated domain